MVLSKQVMLVVSCCLLLFLCGQFSANAINSTNKSAETITIKNESSKLQSSKAHISIKRDPTRPPGVISMQLADELAIQPEYKLTAIFTRNAQQYAVLNGNIVKKGDAFEDMTVIDITSSQIVMSDKGNKNKALIIDLFGASDIKEQVTK